MKEDKKDALPNQELNDEELDKVAGGASWGITEYYIDPDLCVACGACADECPTCCISIAGDHAVISQDECIQCGTCDNVCPTGAASTR